MQKSSQRNPYQPLHTNKLREVLGDSDVPVEEPPSNLA